MYARVQGAMQMYVADGISDEHVIGPQKPDLTFLTRSTERSTKRRIGPPDSANTRCLVDAALGNTGVAAGICNLVAACLSLSNCDVLPAARDRLQTVMMSASSSAIDLPQVSTAVAGVVNAERATFVCVGVV